jgi:putative RecB family exonuclease
MLPVNRLASLPVVEHLSYSAVSLFQSCPLRFYFRYVEKLPERVVSASLVFGSAMHAAVQFHFEELLIGNGPPDIDMLMGVFEHSWQAHDGQAIRFGKGENAQSLASLAERLLRHFQASAFARPVGRVIGIEEHLRGELIPGVPELLARVDLLVETDEALLLSDFKTARSDWSEDHVADAASQLLIYSELAKKLTDGKPLRLAFAVLTKRKFPELTIHPVPLDPKQVHRTKRVVERVWRSIEAGLFFPRPSPMSCPSCPYREPCRAWTG